MNKQIRAAANVTTVGLVLALAAVSGVASGQLPRPVEPDRLKLNNPVPPLGLPQPGDPLSGPVVDPNVRPAQLQPPVGPGVPGRPDPGAPPLTVPDSPRATVPTGVTTTPAAVSPAPAEPPPPTVRLQVQTPAHVPPGKPVPYKIIVTNSSAANAYRVKVRVPAPEGALGLNKVEPRPDGMTAEFKQPVQVPAEMTWAFKSLGKGEQKVIELEFTPAQGAKDVRARAYVSFEHGQEVITQIEKPKLTVKKTANKETARGEPVTVEVTVTNAGPMPIHKVRLIETATPGFEFRGDTDTVRTDKTNQRVWELGTLARGQSKIVRYQLLGGKQQGGELVTTSNATSEDGGIAETAEAKTRILIPDLGFMLTGPAQVESRKAADYEATVRNNGTLPLTNVVVSIPIPDDCQPTKVTATATRYKDRASWTIPKLAPGEARTFRLSVTANSSGKRVVRATARDQSGAVDAEKTVATEFLGRADLHWKPDVPAILGVDKQAQITVTVQNHGEEADRGVAPRIKIPDGLTVVQVTPDKYTLTKDGEIVFNAVEIKAGKSEVFTVTVKRTQPGQRRVGLRLEATSLGDRPLFKEQTVE